MVYAGLFPQTALFRRFGCSATGVDTRNEQQPDPESISSISKSMEVVVPPKKLIFVSQAGMGSLTEAASNGIPVICLPGMQGDQPQNSFDCQDGGMGIDLRLLSYNKYVSPGEQFAKQQYHRISLEQFANAGEGSTTTATATHTATNHCYFLTPLGVPSTRFSLQIFMGIKVGENSVSQFLGGIERTMLSDERLKPMPELWRPALEKPMKEEPLCSSMKEAVEFMAKNEHYKRFVKNIFLTELYLGARASTQQVLAELKEILELNPLNSVKTADEDAPNEHYKRFMERLAELKEIVGAEPVAFSQNDA